MPPWRAVGVTAEGFRALQRQIEALQEHMHRGMNLTERDESEDEREEEQANQKNKKKKFWTQKKKSFSKPLPRLEKDLSLKFPHFLENLT